MHCIIAFAAAFLKRITDELRQNIYCWSKFRRYLPYMMRYQAAFFDAAETLFTTQGTVGEIYADVARQYGSIAKPEEIQAAFRSHFQNAPPLTTHAEKAWWKDIVRKVFADVGLMQDFDGFFEEVYDRFRDSRGWFLFSETREVLQTLKDRGVPMGIVSNFDSRLYSVLSSLGIETFFRSITISSEAGYAKPDSRIFAAAAKDLAVPPAQAIFIGDSLVDDYRAAENSGFQSFLLDRSNRYAEMKSVRRIQNLREVLPFLA